MTLKEAREFLANPPISKRASHYIAEGFLEGRASVLESKKIKDLLETLDSLLKMCRHDKCFIDNCRKCRIEETLSTFRRFANEGELK